MPASDSDAPRRSGRPATPVEVPPDARRGRLDGALCVVTGASSGIGQACARLLAAEGAHLVLVARRQTHLEQTRIEALEAAAAAGRPEPYVRLARCDLASRREVAELAISIERTEGRVDVLVNNAGMPAGVELCGPDSIIRHDEVMQVNYTAPVHLTAYLLPLLRDSDRAAIVNVSSIAGTYAAPDSAIYSASKFALLGFSEGLAGQLAPDDIHVAAVLPGPIPTESWPHERLVGSLPGRLLTRSPDAVARVIVRCAGRRRTRRRTIPRAFAWGLPLKALAPRSFQRLIDRFGRTGSA